MVAGSAPRSNQSGPHVSGAGAGRGGIVPDLGRRPSDHGHVGNNGVKKSVADQMLSRPGDQSLVIQNVAETMDRLERSNQLMMDFMLQQAQSQQVAQLPQQRGLVDGMSIIF